MSFLVVKAKLASKEPYDYAIWMHRRDIACISFACGIDLFIDKEMCLKIAEFIDESKQWRKRRARNDPD